MMIWTRRCLGKGEFNPKFSPGFRNERLKYNLSRQGGKKISTFDEEIMHYYGDESNVNEVSDFKVV